MKAFIAAIVMAIVTYITRVLPIALVNSKLKSNFLRSFLFYVPFAVLGAMTFPGILYSTQHRLAAFIGMLVAVGLAYFEKNLMTVAVSAIFVVYICELIM